MKLFKGSIRHACRNVDAEVAILGDLFTALRVVFVSLFSLAWTAARINAAEPGFEALA